MIYNNIPENSRVFIESIDFHDNYPGAMNEDNHTDILKAAKAKKQGINKSKV